MQQNIAGLLRINNLLTIDYKSDDLKEYLAYIP